MRRYPAPFRLAVSRSRAAGSSSTTSTVVALSISPAICGASMDLNCGWVAGRSGKVMVKVEPSPGLLATVTSPPKSWQKFRVITNPSPVPPYFSDVVISAWLNAWNSRPSCSSVGNGKAYGGPAILDTFRYQCDATVLRELVGVAKDIEQALFEPGAVGAHAAKVIRQAVLDCITVLFRKRDDDRTHLFEQRNDLDVSRKISIRPASIFDRSRMSLMRPSRCRPAPSIFFRSGTSLSRPRSTTSS